MATVNRMLRLQFPILVLIALGLLVWSQRKSFAKVRPGAGGCGDAPTEEEERAARPARQRRR